MVADEDEIEIEVVNTPTPGSFPLAPAAPAAPEHSGARTDAQLVDMWLKTKRSPETRRAYLFDVESFLGALRSAGKGLRGAKLVDLQDWIDGLDGADSTRARRVAAVKSLLSFGHRLGYTTFNVGAVVSVPRVQNKLAERILTEDEVQQMFRATSNARNLALLRLLYYSGARISEACGLCWEHIHVTPEGYSTITLHGKGGKTRHVVVPENITRELLALRDDEEDKVPVFRTKSGRALLTTDAAKMVRATAKRAGIKRAVSPHWFRHAMASHALARGAPVSVVQATLGHSNLSTTGRYMHVRPNDSAGMYLQ